MKEQFEEIVDKLVKANKDIRNIDYNKCTIIFCEKILVSIDYISKMYRESKTIMTDEIEFTLDNTFKCVDMICLNGDDFTINRFYENSPDILSYQIRIDGVLIYEL